MPRPPRIIVPGACYHVLNRANHKAEIFHEPSDYAAFIRLMTRASERVELPVFAVCLMPNHVHLVVSPIGGKDLTQWMHWLFTTHACHYNDKYGKVGHAWQGRYKAGIVQNDHYLLTVLRYVERNAQRARLVSRAEDWRWGSLNWRARKQPPFALTPPPMQLPAWWTEFVNQPQTAAELEQIRTSVNRQRPYGDPEWVEQQAEMAELKPSLGKVGRPRKRRSGTKS